MHGFVCFQTLQYLQQNARERAELTAGAAAGSTASFSIPVAASKMSTQELEELRKQLGSVATGSTLQQVPVLPWCTDRLRAEGICLLSVKTNLTQ